VTLTPRPYQLVGRDHLAAQRIGLLADEMRVGKTPQAIMACEKVDAQRVLVVSPAIAVPMWRFQFPRWYRELYDKPAPARMCVSYEKALIMRDQLLAEPWDVTIVDECHYAGNPEAARTKLIYGKGGFGWSSKQLWALSGTPAPKHAGSLWPLLRAAGVIGMDYVSFCKRYCRIDFLTQRPVGTREEHIPELRALWQKIGLRRMKKEVAPDMPDLEFDFLQIDLDKKVDLADPGTMPDDALLARMEHNAGVDREDRVAVAMAKTGPLLEEVEVALGNGLLKQTVIFGWHLEALKKLVSCLRAMGFSAELLAGETTQAKRVKIQEQFAIGMLDVVVGQIRACGTAIDLSAASHGYFLELDWVPGNNLQAANRLVAIGKEEKVTLDVCTAPGTTDDRVQKVLLRRARELSKLF
jgi:SWI/SNF-related matrix-associated actin-dependent regulator of chromatin subfamily A-like protein 1